jgi:hypothetical protein
VGGVDAQGIPTAGSNAAWPEPTSSPKNEIGFKIYVGSTLDANGYVTLDATGAPTTGTVTPVPANVISWPAPVGATSANTVVVAYNAAGNSAAGTDLTTYTAGANGAVPVGNAPGTQAVAGASIDATGLIVTVPSTANLVVGASVSGGGFPQGTTITAITSATTFTTSLVSTTPGATNVSLTISLAAAAALPTQAASAAPGNLTETLNANGSTTLTWTALLGATGYTVTINETTSAAVVLAPVSVPVAPITTAVTGATIDATGKIVTVASTAGLAVGDYVSGGGFPAGSSITAVTATTFTVSQKAVPVAPATLAAPGTLTVTAAVVTYTTGVLTSGSTFTFAVSATTLSGTTLAASTVLSNNALVAPVSFAGAADATAGSVTLNWANNALNKGNVGGMQLTWVPTAGGTAIVKIFAPTTTGATVIGLTSATSYTFSLAAVSNVTTVAPVAAANTVVVIAP